MFTNYCSIILYIVYDTCTMPNMVYCVIIIYYHLSALEYLDKLSTLMYLYHACTSVNK